MSRKLVAYVLLWVFVASVHVRDLLKVGNVSVYHAATALLFVFLLVKKLVAGNIGKSQLRTDVGFVLIIFWFLVSPLWAGFASEYMLFLGWIGFGYMTWFISREFFMSPFRKVYIRIIAFWFVLLTLFGLFESLTSYHLPTSRIRALELHHLHYVPTATFWNQNDFAFYLVLFLPVTMSLIKNLMARSMAFLGVVYILYLIDSAAAWMAFVVCLVSYLFVHRKYVTLAFVGTLFVIAVATVVAFDIPPFNEHISRIYQVLEFGQTARPGTSIAVRTRLISEGWSAFVKTYGLGLGAGGVRDALRSAGSEIVALHNLPLQILFDGGVPVFLLILFAYCQTIRNLFRRARNANRDDMRHLYGAMCSSLVALPFASLGPAFSLYVSPFWVWLGLISGLSLGDQTKNCH